MTLCKVCNITQLNTINMNLRQTDVSWVWLTPSAWHCMKTCYLHNLVFELLRVFFPTWFVFFRSGNSHDVSWHTGSDLQLSARRKTHKISLLLKDVCEQLSSVSSNYHPCIWVTNHNYNHKTHKYKSLHQLIKAQHVKQQLMCCWCETEAQLHEHYVFTRSKIKIRDVAGGILIQAGNSFLSRTLFLFLTLTQMCTDISFSINTPFYWQVVSASRIGQKHFPNVLRISLWQDCVVKNGICCHVTAVTRKLVVFLTNVHCFDKFLSANTLTSRDEMVSWLLD